MKESRWANIRRWLISLITCGVATVGLALLTSCSSRTFCPETKRVEVRARALPQDRALPSARQDARIKMREWFEEAEITTRAMPGAESEQAVELLALSGGGQYGAFGTGFLNQWLGTKEKANPEIARRFRVVTGVSTGALMSTFVFLGRFDILTVEYTNVVQSDIVRTKPLIPAVLFSNSLLDPSPLEARLRGYLNETMLREVAAEARNGRVLMVASVNLVTGEYTPWNLTNLARNAVDKYDQGDKEAISTACDRYVRILLGSASIPVAFPPQIIDNEPHVDGGSRENIFLGDQLVCMEAALKGNLTLHLLVNGTVDESPQCVKDTVIGIGIRAVGTLLSERMLGNLWKIYAKVLERNANPDAATHWDFNLTYLPLRELPPYTGGSSLSDLIDPAYMKLLYAAGIRHAQDPDAWQKQPPDPDQVERTRIHPHERQN